MRVATCRTTKFVAHLASLALWNQSRARIGIASHTHGYGQGSSTAIGKDLNALVSLASTSDTAFVTRPFSTCTANYREIDSRNDCNWRPLAPNDIGRLVSCVVYKILNGEIQCIDLR